MDSFEIKERLAYTADKSRLVAYEDPEAAFLAFRPGEQIPRAEAEKLGLLEPAAAPAVEKELEAPADKELKPAANKSRPIAKPQTKRARSRPRTTRKK